MGNLQNLRCLCLSKNQIGEIPDEISYLNNLLQLFLGNYKIKKCQLV